MLAHNVYFSLSDNSEEAVRQLVESGRKYLKGHPGEVFFAIGTLKKELNREVNDRNFDVALHVVFASREDHDRYQQDPRHLEFIELNKDNWSQVRVFDSDVTS